MIKTLWEDARSCEQKMSLRDRTRRSKAVKSLMSEGFRELKRTCPLYSITYISNIYYIQ